MELCWYTMVRSKQKQNKVNKINLLQTILFVYKIFDCLIILIKYFIFHIFYIYLIFRRSGVSANLVQNQYIYFFFFVRQLQISVILKQNTTIIAQSRFCLAKYFSDVYILFSTNVFHTIRMCKNLFRFFEGCFRIDIIWLQYCYARDRSYEWLPNFQYRKALVKQLPSVCFPTHKSDPTIYRGLIWLIFHETAYYPFILYNIVYSIHRLSTLSYIIYTYHGNRDRV